MKRIIVGYDLYIISDERKRCKDKDDSYKDDVVVIRRLSIKKKI
jgi:hypothetical protein